MTPIDFDEYNALRATIRERGTDPRLDRPGRHGRSGRRPRWLRSRWRVPPIITLIPLLVLATTFEITFALHTGVERIGRYIQVFFEEPGRQRGLGTPDHGIRPVRRRVARHRSAVRSRAFCSAPC